MSSHDEPKRSKYYPQSVTIHTVVLSHRQRNEHFYSIQGICVKVKTNMATLGDNRFTVLKQCRIISGSLESKVRADLGPQEISIRLTRVSGYSRAVWKVNKIVFGIFSLNIINTLFIEKPYIKDVKPNTRNSFYVMVIEQSQQKHHIYVTKLVVVKIFTIQEI